MIRPKSFVAVVTFTHRRRTFQVGDPVPDGATLATVLRFGGFVKATKPPVETAPEGETNAS